MSIQPHATHLRAPAPAQVRWLQSTARFEVVEQLQVRCHSRVLHQRPQSDVPAGSHGSLLSLPSAQELSCTLVTSSEIEWG